MALLMPKTMGILNEERKPMYPLFQKPSKTRSPLAADDDRESHPAPSGESKESAASNKASNKELKKPKKSATVEKPKTESRSTVEKESDTATAELLEADPNNKRRKRQKTASPDGKPNSDENEGMAMVYSPLPHRQDTQYCGSRVPTILQDGKAVTPYVMEQTAAMTDIKDDPHLQHMRDNTPAISLSTAPSPQMESAPMISAPSTGEGKTKPDHDKTQPNDGAAVSHAADGSDKVEAAANVVNIEAKKILRLNLKTGTIGSPPSKTRDQPIDTISKKRSTTKGKVPISRIVIISYGVGQPLSSWLGHKIKEILDGRRTAASFAEKAIEAPEISKNHKNLMIVGTGPATTPHPFFLPKAVTKIPNSRKAVETPPKAAEITTQEFSTLGRATLQSRDKLSLPPKSKVLASAFSGLGTTARVLKFPGAMEPSWPWKGMIHIRGKVPQRISTDSVSLVPRSKSKKSKYQAVEILPNEDILGTLANSLSVQQVVRDLTDINPDEYPPLPACLRIPTKHFVAGPTVQRKVGKELKMQLPPLSDDNVSDTSEDEIQGIALRRSPVHPALTKLYNSIPTTLSAFDKAQCETQAWTQKYSPSSATEVLQTGREALILKEWLQNLTVMAVESGASDRRTSRATSLSRRLGSSKNDLSGKRKRKSKKLDGFVISSDEAEDDMDEISEPEKESSPNGSQVLLKKTVIRTGNGASKGSKEATKFCNGVVISGPHGCGKSAAVYAVAKELGFEVFEINSSSRRSGKDIIDKVGDMTRNHLVQQSSTQTSAELVDEDAKRISDALDDDLKSGRQGTMNSFFKTKESTKPKSKAKKPEPTAKGTDASTQSVTPKAPLKKQKQSLILFEEVDVLYEEDKQFWATVASMLIQSRRPIIMTCTDESAVPLQMLSLHAILRFSPPPIDLATDYLLLMAASEGHIIRREAVKTLYEGRLSDLRASITDLNFWCQFAVGSFKGGLDWFYPRWPPGNDIDKYGKTLRVISEETYEPGMGLLSRDFLASHVNVLEIEEEMMHEAWNGWCLDIGNWAKDLDLAKWADKMRSLSKGKEDIRATLAMYSDFAESMSTADFCSTGAFSPENQVLMETSLPALSQKVREDYVIALELIEATPLVNFHNLGKDISIWMKSHARNYLQIDQHISRNLEVPIELDRLTETQILNLIRGQSSSADSSNGIGRSDFSLAFDPISEPEKSSLYSTGSLEASTFDRSLSLIATDVAPYVRSIVSYDARLQQERARLSNLLSEGGRRGKRMRTTRAAMSALEGGARNTTRKEMYFGPVLNPHSVLKTGMKSWLDALDLELGDTGTVINKFSKRKASLSRVDSEGEMDELEPLAHAELSVSAHPKS